MFLDQMFHLASPTFWDIFREFPVAKVLNGSTAECIHESVAAQRRFRWKEGKICFVLLTVKL